jgi:hypothetical protein
MNFHISLVNGENLPIIPFLEAASESHIKKTQGRILTVINLTEKSLVLISVKKY